MRCCISCITNTISGTDREKWDYVYEHHHPYLLEPDPREAVDYPVEDDPALIADEAYRDALFVQEWQEWQSHNPNIAFEFWLDWKYRYGTTVYGNLPQHKKHHHVGYSWAPCPYDTVSSGTRSRHLTGSDVPTEGQILHEAGGKHYYMKNKYRGFECTFFDESDPDNPDKNCPYYIANGHKKYFYI